MNIMITVPPAAVAKLLITKEVDLSGAWPCVQSQAVLDALLALPIDSILSIIDSTPNRIVDPATIPQFSVVETLIEVPKVLERMGGSAMNYPQLGFQLKQDLNASLVANTKYGENYGKGAALIGIAEFKDCRILLSALSSGFCVINDPVKQKEIVIRLFFSIPIVQEILKGAKNQQYNGFSAMPMLKKSTQIRRSYSLRNIFAAMATLGNASVNKRLGNIVWNI